MGALVATRKGRLVRVLLLPPEGATLGLSPEGIPELVDDAHPSARLRLAPRGEGLSVQSVAGRGDFELAGRTVAKGSLFAGDRLELEGIGFELDPAAGAPSSTAERLLELLAGAGPQDRDELLARILDEAIRDLGAERGYLLHRPRPGAELRPVARRGLDADFVSARISRTALDKAVAAGRPLLLADARTELAGSASTQVEGLRSILVSPLGEDAALYLDTRSGARAWGQGDLGRLGRFASLARQALAIGERQDQLRRQADRLASLSPAPPLVIGPSAPMRKMLDELKAAAAEDVTVLLMGETGTGKEVLAREIHGASRRRAGPFVAVNCMALSREVLESELFGHEKGAFTGADRRRLGRFELADGGTLFLDEIGELGLDAQVKLLRVLQERTVERVGSAESVPVDIRLVAATNQDLEARVREGRFRQDLYYRLAVFVLRPPPLRERREDVPVLAQGLLANLARRMGKAIDGFTPEALAALSGHDWPGNVRELANVIERALVLEKGPRITPTSLPFAPPTSGAGGPSWSEGWMETLPDELATAREIFETAFMKRAIESARGNVAEAARRLGVPRSTIYRKCEALGIPLNAPEPEAAGARGPRRETPRTGPGEDGPSGS